MIAAELLKLRRNRGVVWTVLLCAVGLPVAAFALDALTRAGWGGAQTADGAFQAAQWAGLAGAVAIGVAAGTADRTAGVLRVLVATGRPRLALAAARLPAVAVVTVAFVLLEWATIALLGTVLRHGQTALDAGHVVAQLPSMLVLNGVLALGGLGLGTAGLSSTQATTLLLGIVLGVMPLAISAPTPQELLALLPPLSAEALLGGEHLVEADLPRGLAAGGLLAWLVVPLAAGAYRAQRAEL